MSEPSKTSRGLIKSMMITGSAQTANIAISIVRMKLLAVLLGPAGVGLLSVYSNLQSMVSGMAGLGIASSGVRQIAASRGDDLALSWVRRVLFASHLVQGLIAMGAVWLLRERLAVWLLGDADHATEVGLVGVAILLSLMGAAQTALLRGLRRIEDLARITVLEALVGTLAGLTAVWFLGMNGLIWFLLVQPLTAFLVALYFTRRLPPTRAPRLGLRDFWREWRPMAKLGAAFMLGGLVTTVTLLLVRSRIAQDLGLDAAGQFAVAWGITMTYVGFLLSAMSMDYYPRLTEIIHERAAATRLMNDQAQLGLALGGPVLLLLIGLAPWVIVLLYSSEFEEAVSLLQWQTVGNVLKLASWAMSFAIVAAARSAVYIFLESSFCIAFMGATWLFLPSFGLEIAGKAFLFAYACYFIVAYVLVRRFQGFRWETLSLKLLGLHLVLAISLLALALAAPLAGAASAVVLAAATGFVGGHIVLSKIGPHGRVAPIARLYAACRWPIRGAA